MGNGIRAVVAGATISAALLLGSCGTPAPGPDAPTTTIDDTACRIERETIETALEAWRVTSDGYPASLEELVGVFLKRAPDFPWTYESTGAAFTLTGLCD